MKGELVTETVAEVPANVTWQAFRALELAKIVDKVLGHASGKIEAIEGDGTVGTIIKIKFPEGTPGAGFFKEKFVKMDDNERVKETEQIEGGYIFFGYDVVRIRYQIIEKDAGSSIIRSTVEYEIDDEKAKSAPEIDISPLKGIVDGVAKYLKENN